MMLLNTLQRTVTLDRIAKFEESMAGPVPDASDILARAAWNGKASMLEDLRAQVTAYDALVSGEGDLDATGADAMGVLVTKARIRSGMSQAEAAVAVNLDEATFARHEAGQFQMAPFHVLMGLAMALRLDVRATATQRAAAHADVSETAL